MKTLICLCLVSMLTIAYFTYEKGLEIVASQNRSVYQIQCDIDAPVNVISDKAINTDEQAQAICKALNY